MHRAQAQTHEFMLRMGSPVYPAAPALRDADLRARLLLEEALETVAGLVGTSRMADLVLDAANAAFVQEKRLAAPPDIVEVVDGLCDTIYVAYGTAEGLGIDLEPHFDLVHAANMMKEPRLINAHGKRGYKPEGWQDPKLKIAELLAVLGVER